MNNEKKQRQALLCQAQNLIKNCTKSTKCKHQRAPHYEKTSDKINKEKFPTLLVFAEINETRNKNSKAIPHNNANSTTCSR